MNFTVAPVVDELIELRGLRFHYRDWPAQLSSTDAPSSNDPSTDGKRAPDLVLLHGYTGHARSWDGFAQAMTDRYRVLALDQRGHGESAWAPADQYGVEDMANDLRAFVSALGLQRVTLLGLSMGGMVTMAYAGSRPPELAACVIVDIAPEVMAVGASAIQNRQQESDVFASREAAFAALRTTNARPPEAQQRHRSDYNLMRTDDGKWTYRYDRALRSPQTLRRRDVAAGWRDCANINVPTQLIRGDLSDILSAEVAQRMVATIPGAQFALVENSGHSVPLDAPDGFLKAARQFLRG